MKFFSKKKTAFMVAALLAGSFIFGGNESTAYAAVSAGTLAAASQMKNSSISEITKTRRESPLL